MPPSQRMSSSSANGGMRIADVIIKKREGKALNEDEIEYFVRGVVDGSIQEAQLGAMLMAMFIRSLDNDETACLTKAMTHSGEVLSWPKEWKGSIVDKHSTGGVGDKVSLVLAPALAACGMKVPMVSGRGLSHTGGTLDKLESIPGYNVNLNHEEMLHVLGDVGCCIVGQTSNLVPADKIMYATRDVTGTTDSIGLIVASIISKKAAEMLDALVLDVKVGKGAFLKTEREARELATRMIASGNKSGCKTSALLTDMNTPIGNMIGNALEVAESIWSLHGRGPEDLTNLVISLGGQLLLQSKNAGTLQEARNKIKSSLHDGSAIAKFKGMMVAQGVDEKVAEALCERDCDVFQILPKAEHVTPICSPSTGYVHDIDAMKCAIVSGQLGAGRTKAGEDINFAVGLELNVKVGDKIDEDTPWITVHHDEELTDEMYIDLQEAITVKEDVVDMTHRGTRVLDIVT